MERSSTDPTTAVAGAQRAPARPAVEMRSITKRFGAVLACDAVDLALPRGQVTGILGENGAGKTTLMKTLMGLISPDEGAILIDGQEVAVRDPLHAVGLGLSMVHQHFSLIEPLTVWENITLGERGRIDAEAAARTVREVGERYGLTVDPRARVHDLSAGQRQRVEIIKCLSRNPSVLILDEPTSVLTLAESRELFAMMRRVVQERNQAVVLISHKLDEILHATDDVVIMRRGRVVGRRTSSGVTARELAREMLGRDVSLHAEAAALGLMDVAVQTAIAGAGTGAVAAPEVAEEAGQAVAAGGSTGAAADAAVGAQPAPSAGDVVLRIRDAVAVGRDGRRLLDGLTMELRAGEILGLAGVEGNGQTALGDVLSGLLELSSGSIEVRGRTVATGRPGAMQHAGVGVIPEDRHRSGCILDMTVAENLALLDLDRFSVGGFLNHRQMRAHAVELIERFGIRTPSPDTAFRSLSGGNQQRVVLAREISRSPAVLVAAHATRGLDVGAIEYVSECLRAAAAAGAAVLVITAELEEILALAHRIAVISKGRIVGEMTRLGVDLDRLGLMMGGQAA